MPLMKGCVMLWLLAQTLGIWLEWIIFAGATRSSLKKLRMGITSSPNWSGPTRPWLIIVWLMACPVCLAKIPWKMTILVAPQKYPSPLLCSLQLWVLLLMPIKPWLLILNSQVSACIFWAWPKMKQAVLNTPKLSAYAVIYPRSMLFQHVFAISACTRPLLQACSQQPMIFLMVALL